MRIYINALIRKNPFILEFFEDSIIRVLFEDFKGKIIFKILIFRINKGLGIVIQKHSIRTHTHTHTHIKTHTLVYIMDKLQTLYRIVSSSL